MLLEDAELHVAGTKTCVMSRSCLVASNFISCLVASQRRASFRVQTLHCIAESESLYHYRVQGAPYENADKFTLRIRVQQHMEILFFFFI